MWYVMVMETYSLELSVLNSWADVKTFEVLGSIGIVGFGICIEPEDAQGCTKP